jgi:iron complex outermembrane receptor protein
MKTAQTLLGILLLAPIAAPAQTAAPVPIEETVELDKYTVQGTPIENYRATDALTGTKTGAAIRDLPLSINVVARELIEDRRLTSLSESLDNMPGVSRKLGYGGTQNFGAYIRGFDTGVITFRNGFRDFGFYTLRDTANVERFEVLKGPSSILYGTLQPGGITHTLTKRPLPTAFNRGTVVVGSDDFYRAEFDGSGPLSATMSYRLNLACEDAGSYRDFVDSRAEFIAPVVTWVLSEKTRWTVEMEYKHSKFVWDLGLPKDPVSLTAPANRFLGENDRLTDVTSFMVSSVVGSGEVEPTVGNDDFPGNVVVGDQGGHQIGDLAGHVGIP